MAFSDLEERKCKHFPEQQHAGARANIAQKPNGASSRGRSFKLAWSVAMGCYVCFCGHNILSFALSELGEGSPWSVLYSFIAVEQFPKQTKS